MVLIRETTAISENDEYLEKCLGEAFIPCVLTALCQTLDDYKYIPSDLQPAGASDVMAQMFDQTGGFSEAQAARGKELCMEGLRELRRRQADGTLPKYKHDAAHEEMVRRCVKWLTGGAASEDYVPLMVEELAPFGEDPRAPKLMISL